LKNFIEKIEKDKTNPIIIIVGQSMGAAVALLEAAYLTEKRDVNPDNLYLITMAEPCPGEK
jgi:surfactin synthase thioesterase subunit